LANLRPHEPNSLERYYYSELVKIWIQNYKAFWSAVYIFLIVQSILFIALFEAASLENQGSFIVFSLSWIGLIVSLMWLFVCGRLRAALILQEHQARHLERRLFHKSIWKPKNYKIYFPMYFSGSRAVFYWQKNKSNKHKPEPFEIKIQKHHDDLPEKDNFLPIDVFSYNRIVAIFLPFLFIIAWGVVTGVSLFGCLRIIERSVAESLAGSSIIMLSIVVILFFFFWHLKK